MTESKPLMGTVKYKKDKNFRKVLNDSLRVFFKDALRVSIKDPKQAYYFIQTARWSTQFAAPQRGRVAAVRYRAGRSHFWR